MVFYAAQNGSQLAAKMASDLHSQLQFGQYPTPANQQTMN
jgi:hypothetical protein